jgi:hypothetical protein
MEKENYRPKENMSEALIIRTEIGQLQDTMEKMHDRIRNLDVDSEERKKLQEKMVELAARFNELVK